MRYFRAKEQWLALVAISALLAAVANGQEVFQPSDTSTPRPPATPKPSPQTPSNPSETPPAPSPPDKESPSTTEPDAASSPNAVPGDTTKEAEPASKPSSKLIRLSPQDKVWIDPQRKLVVVDGEIALTKGQLEMFACPKGTKEHESVVAVDSKAYIVHTALLAVGAESGHPVQFDPVFQIATGDVIDILVLWVDPQGKKHQVRAQTLVRNTKTQKAMTHDWVFGGSGFWFDESTGEQNYLAESGDLICVSNFPTATMDIQVRSDVDNENLLFEAFTENIPPRGTKVRLVLIPRKKPASPANTGNPDPPSNQPREAPATPPSE